VAIEMILAKIRQRLSTTGAPVIPMVADEHRHHPGGSHATPHSHQTVHLATEGHRS
jgi:hypothetical protein